MPRLRAVLVAATAGARGAGPRAAPPAVAPAPPAPLPPTPTTHVYVSRHQWRLHAGRREPGGIEQGSSSSKRALAARATTSPAYFERARDQWDSGPPEVEAGGAAAQDTVGVLLLNLGGPETLADVEPFLYNLFADPDIIRLPSSLQFLQPVIAQLVSAARAPKSREGYQSIGGGSPLRRITEDQAAALREALERKGLNAHTYVAMRYWKPFTGARGCVGRTRRGAVWLTLVARARPVPLPTTRTLAGWLPACPPPPRSPPPTPCSRAEEAIEAVKRDGITRLVVLPLYPQFSVSTSGSSLRLLEKLLKEDPVLQQVWGQRVQQGARGGTSRRARPSALTRAPSPPGAARCHPVVVPARGVRARHGGPHLRRADQVCRPARRGDLLLGARRAQVVRG